MTIERRRLPRRPIPILAPPNPKPAWLIQQDALYDVIDAMWVDARAVQAKRAARDRAK
jgi:hypothetical protein